MWISFLINVCCQEDEVLLTSTKCWPVTRKWTFKLVNKGAAGQDVYQQYNLLKTVNHAEVALHSIGAPH